MRKIQGTRFIELILFKAYAELKAEAARNYVSFLWWMIEPVIYMGAFYVVFGIVFQRGGENFVAFLLCGLVAWKWFSSTVNQGASSILSNTGLIRQVYLEKIIFPGAVLITNTVRFSFIFVLFIIFLLIYGIYPQIEWISLPVVLFVQFVFTAACAGLASVMVPFIPDLKLLINNGLLLMFFLSGIFFDIAAVPERLRVYLCLNPMMVIINGYREILLRGRWPEWNSMAVIGILSIIGIYFAHRLIMKYDRLYPKVLM